jgi:hypothetical protein
MRNSSYGSYHGRSDRLNRSTSGSRQYAYKLDQINNRLAERNNPLLSFYRDKSQDRVKTAQRNFDSSHLKKNIENYGRPPSGQRKPQIKHEKPPVAPRENEKPQDSRRSSRGQMTYSRSLKNSADNVMQTSAQNKHKYQPLDVIYEDPYGQDGLDPKQAEILQKYYLQSRRHLRPSQRMMKTPMMTPDNNIKFVDNGSLIKNPKPTRTPPPPLWGEESEIDETAGEPFYDPRQDPARDSKALQHLDATRSKRKKFIKEQGEQDDDYETVVVQGKRPKGSKLKKKIVYVYDSDSDEDGAGSQRKQMDPYVNRSSNNRSYIGSNRSQISYNQNFGSRRAELHNKSTDLAAQKPYKDLPSR